MEVLYEDNHLIIVNKSPGEIVQGDKTGDTPLIDVVKEYLKNKYNKPGNVFCGLVHRLDRPVGGVVVFAKTSKALSRMNAIFQNREVEKTYWAIVKDRPPKDRDTLTHYITSVERNNKSYASLEPGKGLKAVLDYAVIAKSENYYLLEVRLHTGRKHQIRVQLSAIGCPIKGDLKYGYPRSNFDASISLQAHRIKFVHPISKEIVDVLAPVPSENLWQVLAQNQFSDTEGGHNSHER